MPEPLRILIVDDDRTVRRALAMRLQLETGINVVGEAADGVSGIELARSLRPDVVLLDVHMPGMGGLEACRQIRAAGIAVVMLSLDETHSTRQDCHGAGANAFISKQGRIGELLGALYSAGGRANRPACETRRSGNECARWA